MSGYLHRHARRRLVRQQRRQGNGCLLVFVGLLLSIAEQRASKRRAKKPAKRARAPAQPRASPLLTQAAQQAEASAQQRALVRMTEDRLALARQMLARQRGSETTERPATRSQAHSAPRGVIQRPSTSRATADAVARTDSTSRVTPARSAQPVAAPMPVVSTAEQEARKRELARQGAVLKEVDEILLALGYKRKGDRTAILRDVVVGEHDTAQTVATRILAAIGRAKFG